MKVKVTTEYFDRELEKVVEPETEFEVKAERGKMLISKGYVKEVKTRKSKKVETNEEVIQ